MVSQKHFLKQIDKNIRLIKNKVVDLQKLKYIKMIDLRGKYIEVLSEEHGQKVKKFFEDNGYNSYYKFNSPGDYYYIRGNSIDLSSKVPEEWEEIKLPEDTVEELTFPRWVMSKDYENEDWVKRCCVASFNGLYVCFSGNLKCLGDVDHCSDVYLYRQIKEIEKPKVLELTLEEIAEKFEVSVKDLKIKS